MDATAAVGRVYLEDSYNSLGVLLNEYQPGKTITVPQGDRRFITVFNGKEDGVYYLTFS